jgi:hypothetical protein
LWIESARPAASTREIVIATADAYARPEQIRVIRHSRGTAFDYASKMPSP